MREMEQVHSRQSFNLHLFYVYQWSVV